LTRRFLDLGRQFAVLPSPMFLPFLQILHRLQFALLLLPFVLRLRFDCAKPKDSENLTVKFR
jgi:hypothetical protein